MNGSNTDDVIFNSAVTVERGYGRRIIEGSFKRLSGSYVDFDKGTIDNVLIGYSDGDHTEGENSKPQPGTVSKASLTTLTSVSSSERTSANL